MTNNRTVLTNQAKPAENKKVQPAPDQIVFMIGFSFSCPHCKHYHDLYFHEARHKYGDKIAFQAKHFPLGFPNDLSAHRAAEAARKQNKFWEVHDKLFETQESWRDLQQSDFTKFLKEVADEIGLNIEQFQSDLNSQEVLDAIAADVLELENKGVISTPTVFVKKPNLNQEAVPIPEIDKAGVAWFSNLIEEAESNKSDQQNIN